MPSDFNRRRQTAEACRTVDTVRKTSAAIFYMRPGSKVTNLGA